MKYLPILFFIIITGCSLKMPQYDNIELDSNLSLESNKKNSLAKRFLSYWNYRNHREYQKSYEYETPLYRYMTEEKAYINSSKGTESDYLITLLNISYLDSAHNVAQVEYRYQKKNRTLQYKENWFFLNNRWYHQYFVPRFPGDKPTY